MSPRLWTPRRLKVTEPRERKLWTPRQREQLGPITAPELLAAIAQGREAVLEALSGRKDEDAARTRRFVEGANSREYRGWRKRVQHRAVRDREMRRTFKGIVPRRTAYRLQVSAMARAAREKENAS